MLRVSLLKIKGTKAGLVGMIFKSNCLAIE